MDDWWFLSVDDIWKCVKKVCVDKGKLVDVICVYIVYMMLYVMKKKKIFKCYFFNFGEFVVLYNCNGYYLFVFKLYWFFLLKVVKGELVKNYVINNY